MRPETAVPIVAYLLGAIPFGFLLVRTFQKADIRDTGSGNIGATNVYRKSKWGGVVTLLLDGGKGYLAVMTAAWLGTDQNWQAVAALMAIIGHAFTVFLGFKGGKGVATGCGAYLALSPLAAGSALAVFVATVALTRYVSLASILATGALPLWAWMYGEPRTVVGWASVGAAVIIGKHHTNIRRLWRGTEHRFGAHE